MIVWLLRVQKTLEHPATRLSNHGHYLSHLCRPTIDLRTAGQVRPGRQGGREGGGDSLPSHSRLSHILYAPYSPDNFIIVKSCCEVVVNITSGNRANYPIPRFAIRLPSPLFCHPPTPLPVFFRYLNAVGGMSGLLDKRVCCYRVWSRGEGGLNDVIRGPQ